MESKDSVRNRLRVDAIDADDRALLDEQIAERQALAAEPEYDDLIEAAPVRRPRPGLDALLDTLVRGGYGVDAAARYARAKPLTAFAIAAGVGVALAGLLARGRRH
jgi:ElaB/YqjD/DUF883 family membrane-anchored ribosome-binding protein